MTLQSVARRRTLAPRPPVLTENVLLLGVRRRPRHRRRLRHDEVAEAAAAAVFVCAKSDITMNVRVLLFCPRDFGLHRLAVRLGAGAQATAPDCRER